VLVLLTLFPPKIKPGEKRAWSRYYLTTCGAVLLCRPQLVEAVARDLQQLPGHSLGLIVNEPLPRPADRQPNTGNGANWGASNAHIGPCRWLFAECDLEGLSLADQLALAVAVAGAEPTFTVYTGGKSLHSYWRLAELISPDRFTSLQELLIAAYEHQAPGCKVDGSLAKPAQVMRLAGGTHPSTGRLACIHTASGTVLGADALEARLQAMAPAPVAPPPPPRPPSRPGQLRRPQRIPLPSQRGKPPTLEQIREALKTCPPRVPGKGDYVGKGGARGDRNWLWGLVRACEAAGGTVEDAIAMMESHSPGATSGWDVRQIAMTCGDQATPAWFWGQVPGGHPSKRTGQVVTA
jgi:hypothetical protein